MLILLWFLCHSFQTASHYIFSAIQLHFFRHLPIAVSDHSKIKVLLEWNSSLRNH